MNTRFSSDLTMSVDSVVAAAGQLGAIIGVHFHGGYTATNIGIILDALLYNQNANVMTYKTAMRHVAGDVSGLLPGGVTIDNGATYTRTLANQSDYHLRTDSPCLGSGTKIAGVTTDIEGNPLFPPYNIGPYGLSEGALGVSSVANDGPPRNNITRLSGPSATIILTDTYELEDTNAWRVVTGWTAGTANDFFDENGEPIPFLGQQLIDSGIGYQLYYGRKGVAGYAIEQDAKSHKNIVRFLRVNTYLDSILYDPDKDYNW